MSSIEMDARSAEVLWQEFRLAHPAGRHEREEPPAEYFGDSPELADELLALVIAGTKRATAALVAEFADGGEELPRIGSHWMACDGRGTARLVLRSMELRVGPVTSVDERFAHDEGEGDRSRASWLEGHRRYWARSCARMGMEYSDDLEAVFERFAVVWPPKHAD